MRRPRDIRPTNSFALLVPLHALQALQAVIARGESERLAVFELSTRDIGSNDFAIMAGLGRALEQLAGLRFDADIINFLADYLDEATLAYLERFTFSGAISAYAEGEAFFPGSPIVTVEAKLGEALLLEGLLTSSMNEASAVATAAGHLRRQLPNQRLYELWGSYSEAAGVYAAHAAFIAGADATSTPLATRTGGNVPLYDLPTRISVDISGDELTAFTTLLTQDSEAALPLDTLEPEAGVAAALAAAEVTGVPIFAVSLELDGELTAILATVRKLLDEAGSLQTNVILRVTDPGMLTPELLRAIRIGEVQVDALAVNFRALFDGAPHLSLQYRLVELENTTTESFERIDGIGRKVPYREFGEDWSIARELLVVSTEQDINHEWRMLQTPYIHAGKVLKVPDLHESRDLARENLTILPRGTVPVVLLPEPTPAADLDEETVLHVDPTVIPSTRRTLHR